VALVGRDRAALDETAGACPDAIVAVADVATAEGVASLEPVLAELGGSLDLLANVAGAPISSQPLERIPDEAWEASWALNLMAAVRLQRLCLPALERARGAIVNVGSVAAKGGIRNSAAYAAAKAALVAVTRAAAIEWAPKGIRVNIVEPAFVSTEFNAPLVEAGLADRMIAKMPTRTAITPESVAATILYLGSPANRDITGAVVPIDGGWTAKL
jgi:NAD(P)-dependent dehydrogenase (short-subunit alcohol dehydrogenase family)